MERKIDESELKGHHGYLRTAEVARIFHVSTKTVARWATLNKLPHMKTLGGHRRFPEDVIRQIAERLAGSDQDPEEVLDR
ncbi:MAG: helix-turn-helix domain-containing protein [Actinomycetota bacterium]